MTFLRLSVLALTALSTACVVHYDESSFIRARPAPALDVAKAQAALPPGYQVETGFVETTDGQKLYRVAFTHPQARSDVLFFPGNGFLAQAEAVSYAQPFLAQWRPDVVFYDYRGRGQSTGAPNVATLRADALLAFDAERRRADAQGRKLVVAGFSLGGVVAAGVAEVRRPDALILMATGTNAEEFAQESMPWYAKPFVDVEIAPAIAGLDNRRSVAKYTGPLLIVAAADDGTTPPVLSQLLYAAATASVDRQLVIVPNVEHNDLPGSAELAVALKQFAERNGL